MRTRTVHPGPDADPDPAGSPTGQELVEDLEKTITREEADKYPPPGSKEDVWMLKVLEQATKVLCLAEEACDKTTKGDRQPCTYQRYRWRMDQEVGHLYALFGGPEEDEVRVKGQRLAKAWLAKAHDSVEEARKHMGLQLQRASKLSVAQKCQHDGPPTESRLCLGKRTQAHERTLRRVPRQCGLANRRLGAGEGTGRRLRVLSGAIQTHPSTATLTPPTLR